MTTEEKLRSRYDIDYDMGDRSYALGRLAYRKKRFSAYDYRAISSFGYGYRAMDGPYLGWNLEGGPGYRLNRLEHRPGTDSEVVGRLSSNLEWQLTDFAVFRNTLGVFAGTHTSTLNTTTSLALDMASRLSGEFAVETMTDTNGPEGKKKTEITSTARLLFQF